MDLQELLQSPCEAEDWQRRVGALARLVDVTHALAAEIDLETILQRVTSEACHALGCDRASFYQFDEERQELYTSVVTELEINEIRHDLRHGITGDVARTRKIANVADPQGDSRWDSSVDRATGYQTRNILAAPLTAPRDGSLLGVIQLINKFEGSFDHFDEQLLEAFGQHAAVALDRARLIADLQQRREVEASLSVARDVQRGFMPHHLPEIAGYELASWWFPNQAVGGDYCDVLPLRDGRTALVIADVSGHGLGPSLIMASVRAALRALVLEHSAPEVLLEMLARALADDFDKGHFITMVAASLDPRRHTLDFANAGHAPAEHFCAATQVFTSLESTGLPLGVVDQPEYPPGPTVRIGVGDLIVLCTDGIVEAMDDDGRQFGRARLEAIVRELASKSVQEIVGEVGRQVDAHYEGDNPPDDLTILAVRRNA